MQDAAKQLQNFKPKKKYFVGIDSDGCVFDSMEIKHKECFTPEFILHYGLQPVSKFARETWEFVNLYSTTRGVNRFPAVLRVLELLRQRPEVVARGVAVADLAGLRAWVQRETRLGNARLAEEVEKSGDEELRRVLAWSNDVNAAIKRLVRDVPPFPLVRESLAKLRKKADLIVCSQTPTEALVREWEEHGIREHARLICGQELGTKAEHLQIAAAGKYEHGKCLMIGDAPGDLRAARTNEMLFYPINPGMEEASWKRFHDEGIDRFLGGSFAGEYEDSLIHDFEDCLPEAPPWKSP